jgi:hypothetical protein
LESDDSDIASSLIVARAGGRKKTTLLVGWMNCGDKPFLTQESRPKQCARKGLDYPDGHFVELNTPLVLIANEEREDILLYTRARGMEFRARS